MVPFSTDYLTPAGAFYRPLFWLSLSLDHAVWGLPRADFYFSNLLLLWLCGLLLFRLLGRLEVPGPLVFAIRIVWLVLPLNTEVVAWISGRPASLATAFVLSGLLALKRFVGRRRIRDLVVLGLMFFAALGSHEIGLVLPISQSRS